MTGGAPDAGAISRRLEARARGGQAGAGRWVRVESFETVDSTQSAAAERERDGAEDGLVVLAGAQESGRGRSGNAWVSHPGEGLYLTAMLRPRAGGGPAADWSLAAAVAACGAVRALGLPEAVIKWPNDLLAGGRKLAGLLVDTRLAGETIRAVLIGFGLNLGQGMDRFGGPLAATATSFRIAGAPGGVPSREAAAAEFLTALGEAVLRLEQGDRKGLRAAYEAVAPMTRGAGVAFDDAAGGRLTGTTEGLADDGGLRVRLTAGGVRVLRADAVHTLREVSACSS